MKYAKLIAVTLVGVFPWPAMAQNKQPDAWAKEFNPPTTLKTPRLLLEPLKPEHAELDHQALMSSRKHLRKTLHWGDWPKENMTVDQNRRDLARHWKEFENKEAYAYTVLTPDRKQCVGCVYINPVKNKPRAVAVAYWVVEKELANALDEHLVQSLLDWITKDWPLDMLVMPLHTDNQRGIEVAKKIKLIQGGPARKEQVRFFWRRNGR